MKVTANKIGSDFNPVEVRIMLESQEEVDTLFYLTNASTDDEVRISELYTVQVDVGVLGRIFRGLFDALKPYRIRKDRP